MKIMRFARELIFGPVISSDDHSGVYRKWALCSTSVDLYGLKCSDQPVESPFLHSIKNYLIWLFYVLDAIKCFKAEKNYSKEV